MRHLTWSSLTSLYTVSSLCFNRSEIEKHHQLSLERNISDTFRFYVLYLNFCLWASVSYESWYSILFFLIQFLVPGRFTVTKAILTFNHHLKWWKNEGKSTVSKTYYKKSQDACIWEPKIVWTNLIMAYDTWHFKYVPLKSFSSTCWKFYLT